MEYIIINNKKYCTIKDVYMNLCVTRNSIIKKIDKLEKKGYVLRIKDKRPSIYLSYEGYKQLKEERIQYLNDKINDKNNTRMKEYYIERKESIEKPELWNRFHGHEISINLYINN